MRRRDETSARSLSTVISSDISERSILFAFTKEPLARAMYDYEHDMIDS